MTVSGRLAERIDATWSRLVSLVHALGPGGLEISGPDGWAVKDHLAHVAAWEQWLMALFAGEDRLAAMGLEGGAGEDVDAINARIWALHRKKSAEEALAFFHETHRRLVAVLERFSDEDLELPYAHYDPASEDDAERARPVSLWVAANTYDHYAEHIDWIRSLAAEGG